MPGPAPKDPALRIRRHVPVSGDWITLSEPYDGPVPELPAPKGQWSKSIRAWWETVWRTPMATQWHIPGDVPALVELAQLRRAAAAAGAPVSLWAEIRLRSDQFGLSPRGRQNLRWALPGEGPAIETDAEDELERRRKSRETRLGG